MHSCIVYQAYGPEYILRECMFSLLRLYAVHSSESLKQREVWIYTDQQEWFEKHFPDCPLVLKFRTVNQELLNQWRGDINFVHRVKIEVLRDLCRHFSGNIVYLDTDTYPIASLDPIFEDIQNGKLYMHVQESLLAQEANPIMRKLNRFLSKNQPLIVKGKSVSIPADITMWNAGMIGFRSTEAPILDQILEFTDDVYRRFPKHVVEQFACSLYFQQAGEVKSSAAEIFHYWNFKEMRAYLESLFAHFQKSDWTQLAHYSFLIQPQVQLQEMVGFYRARNGWQKMRRKAWKPIMPDWDQLLQQMAQPIPVAK